MLAVPTAFAGQTGSGGGQAPMDIQCEFKIADRTVLFAGGITGLRANSQLMVITGQGANESLESNKWFESDRLEGSEGPIYTSEDQSQKVIVKDKTVAGTDLNRESYSHIGGAPPTLIARRSWTPVIGESPVPPDSVCCPFSIATSAARRAVKNDCASRIAGRTNTWDLKRAEF